MVVVYYESSQGKWSYLSSLMKFYYASPTVVPNVTVSVNRVTFFTGWLIFLVFSLLQTTGPARSVTSIFILQLLSTNQTTFLNIV